MPAFRVVRERPESVKCDLLAVGVFTGAKPGPGAAEAAQALGTTLKDLLASERGKGELGEAIVVPTYGKLNAKRVAFVGLGDAKKAGTFQIRRAGAVVARRAGTARIVGTAIPLAGGTWDESVGAFAEGFLLGLYRFDRYKKASENGARPEVQTVIVASEKARSAATDRAFERAQATVDGTNIARDLTNVPANDKSPASLAEEARKIGRARGIAVKVLDEKQLAAKGFGGLLAVGRGSPNKPPRLIEMRYTARGARKTVALIGKGITFDSGGINLKTSSLDWMKMDMGGAAAVLGVMDVIGRLKPKVNVLGIICSAENMPGGNAIHPGDVITMYGGQTVEIGNTDAEGRLVMADGLVWARERGAKTMVDIATLTGACMVALGPRAFGVLGNDSGLTRALLDSAERAGEMAWELPIYDDYRKLIDSDVADMKNIGGPTGGAITAALFLREFVGDTPWAHLDIAGPTKSESEEFEQPKGATGSGVRTLVEWLTSL